MAHSNNCVLTVQTIFNQLGKFGACLVKKDAIVSPLSGLWYSASQTASIKITWWKIIFFHIENIGFFSFRYKNYKIFDRNFKYKILLLTILVSGSLFVFFNVDKGSIIPLDSARSGSTVHSLCDREPCI